MLRKIETVKNPIIFKRIILKPQELSLASAFEVSSTCTGMYRKRSLVRHMRVKSLLLGIISNHL